MKTILILMPIDRESLKRDITTINLHLAERKVETQSPAYWAEALYNNMKTVTDKSFFNCLLMATEAYKQLVLKGDSIFASHAPLRIMFGLSTTDIIYDEVWLYDRELVEDQMAYFESLFHLRDVDIDSILKLYRTNSATKEFTNIEEMIGEIINEFQQQTK